MTNKLIPKNQCQATNKHGFKCRRSALTGSEYCPVHDERYKETVQASAETASQGHIDSIAKKKLVQLNSYNDLIAIQRTAILELARKPTRSTKDAAAISALSNSMIRALKEQALLERLLALDKKSLAS